MTGHTHTQIQKNNGKLNGQQKNAVTWIVEKQKKLLKNVFLLKKD